MSKTLVAYFSATGVTEEIAERLAHAIGADLWRIEPLVPYTAADLDWTDENSRSTIEMRDPSSRPGVRNHMDNMDEYDTVFLGFPIWWYVAPTIINTFLENYDFSGKTLIPFATSGSSGMGKTNERLSQSLKGARLLEGKRIRSGASAKELSDWAKNLIG